MHITDKTKEIMIVIMPDVFSSAVKSQIPRARPPIKIIPPIISQIIEPIVILFLPHFDTRVA